MSIHSPSSLAPATSQLSSHANEGRYATTKVGRGLVGIGLTGLILRLNEDRVIKVAKTFTAANFPEHDLDSVEYMNDINCEALELEKRIYERLGDHPGIIRCFKTSSDGIELAFAVEGDLENFIRTNTEPPECLKVFVDEIALRNVLVDKGQLKFSDFGQSYLLPMTVNVDTACENGLTAKIEILHLGWIIYSISVWAVHKYYYFKHGDPPWLSLQDLPPTEYVFYGTIIQKCWNGDYVNMEDLNKDALLLAN